MKIMDRVLAVVERAKCMQITTDKEMEEGRKALVYIADMKKSIHETFDPINKKNHAAWKEGLTQMQKHLKPLLAAKMIIDPMMGTYLAEKERKRQAEEREQRKQEAAAADAAAELLEQAMVAEEKGDSEKASALIERLDEKTAEVAVASEKTKLEGVHTRTDVKWRIINLEEVPRPYLVLDERKLNSLALKLGTDARVPGIEFFEKTTVITKATSE